MKPKVLVLGGGGVRALSFIGSLSVLDASSMLTDIKSYYGVSAGALIAVLLLVGYTVSELVAIVKTFDFTRLQHIEVDNLLNFTETLGIDNGTHLVQVIGELFEAKGISKTITFKELYDKTACELFMFGTNLNKLLPVKLSCKTTPDLQVISGLRITMAVPGWLTPIPMPDASRMLADGGLCNNYPIVYVPADEKPHVLGITLNKKSDQCASIADVATYINQLLSCSIHSNMHTLVQKYATQTITVPVFVPFLKFDLTPEERDEMIKAGASAATEFMKDVCKFE